MTKILVIAGHGENKNGSFDPGATGIITKGEHLYYEQNFFPAVKKFLPANSNVVLFSEHNVYDYKDLVTLARKYGNDTIVVEMHYDAGSSAASGGHVIVHKNYAPDAFDLKIRNVIKKHIGVRYNHKGEQGISGRDNLYNCNVAANNGINYRLVELGFGTNANDAAKMVKGIEAIAKDFVEALVGSSNNVATENKIPPVVKPQQPTTSAKTIDQLAKEVIQGEHGSGDDRKKSLGNQYDAVQSRVNELLGGNKTVPAAKSIDTLVKETLAGVHGNGDARKKSLGSNYNAVMAVINGGSTAKAAAKNKRVYLQKSAKTWRVYKTSGPYTTGKEVGFLAPAQYGGLDYEIIKTLATDVYQIKTGSFGNVAIYAAKSTGATIK